MRQVWLLAVNDLRLTWRDRAAFFWLLVFPVAMMGFFGSLGGSDEGAQTPAIALGLVNHDDGWLSRAFVEELQDEALNFREMTPAEYAAAEDTVRTLVIPPDFTRLVLAGEPQTLRLEKKPGSNESFGVAAEVHVTRAIVRVLGRLIELEPGPEAEVALARFRELAARPDLVTLDVATAGTGRPVPSGLRQSVPGIMTFLVLMMTLIYGGVFLTIEKSSGMLRRQSVLPMSRRRLIAGKLLGRLLLAAAQITLLVVVGRYLYGVSWGRSPLGLLLVLTAYAFAVAGLATLLGAVLRTPAQASSVGWIVSMVLAALGGCWWPSEVMPGWLWQVAHALPTAWAMDAFHALISFGQGLEAVLLPAAVLALFGAGSSLLAARLLRTAG